MLAEAQRLGLAEADPSTDVDGIDSAHKLALLTDARLRRARRASPTSRPRASGSVEAIDIAFARELGYTIKLLADREGRRATPSRRASTRR